LPLQDTGYGRLDSTGRPDAGFTVDGPRQWPDDFYPNWGAWLRLPDGSTLLGGTCRGRAALVRLDDSGVPDPDFAGGGMVQFEPALGLSIVSDVAIGPGGKVLVLTSEYTASSYYDAPTQVFAWRLDQRWQQDEAFGDGGKVLLADYRTYDRDTTQIDSYFLRIQLLWDGTIQYLDDVGFGSFPGVPAPRTRHSFVLTDGVPAEQPGEPSFPSPDPSIALWYLAGELPGGDRLVIGRPEHHPRQFMLCRLDAGNQRVQAFGDSGCLVFHEEAVSHGWFVTHVSTGSQWLYVASGADDHMLVTRVHITGPAAGSVDEAFGSNGTVRFGFATQVHAMQGTSDGALLLQTDQGTWRLLPDDKPSPGIVSLSMYYVHVSSGPLGVRVTRSAGSSGTLDVDFSTEVFQQDGRDETIAGVDFEPRKETLTWGDGDAADKELVINVWPQFAIGYSKRFALNLQGSGAAPVAINWTMVFRKADAPINPAPAPTGFPVRRSGGGAFDPATLLALAFVSTFIVWRRLRTAPTTPVACLRRTAGRWAWAIADRRLLRCCRPRGCTARR
jgi:hypothetical protein